MMYYDNRDILQCSTELRDLVNGVENLVYLHNHILSIGNCSDEFITLFSDTLSIVGVKLSKDINVSSESFLSAIKNGILRLLSKIRDLIRKFINWIKSLFKRTPSVTQIVNTTINNVNTVNRATGANNPITFQNWAREHNKIIEIADCNTVSICLRECVRYCELIVHATYETNGIFTDISRYANSKSGLPDNEKTTFLDKIKRVTESLDVTIRIGSEDISVSDINTRIRNTGTSSVESWIRALNSIDKNMDISDSITRCTEMLRNTESSCNILANNVIKGGDVNLDNFKDTITELSKCVNTVINKCAECISIYRSLSSIYIAIDGEITKLLNEYKTATGRKIPVYGYHRKDSGFNRMK